jgi:hypothetical protein
VISLRDRLVSSDSPQTQYFKSAALASDGLPIYVDLGAYVIVLADGQILVLDSTTLERLDPKSFVEGEMWLNHALERAILKYPDLENWEFE